MADPALLCLAGIVLGGGLLFVVAGKWIGARLANWLFGDVPGGRK